MNHDNYIHLQKIFSKINELLAEYFRTKYENYYGLSWIDGSRAQNRIFNSLNLNNTEKMMLEKGTLKDWDYSFLSKVLLGLTELKCAYLSVNILEVKKIRNKLAHSSNMIIKDDEYKDSLKLMIKLLEKIGCKPSEIDIIKDIKCIKSVTNIALNTGNEIFLKLKQEGNKLFSNKNYESAIEKFTDALGLTTITENDRGILYSNRAAAHLELFLLSNDQDHLDSAINNAKLSIVISPNFLKNYYRLAKAYEYKGKLEKALLYYRKSLALDPANEDIKNSIGNISLKTAKDKRFQHLDPDLMPASMEEIRNKRLNMVQKTMGKNFTMNDLNKATKMLQQIDPTYVDMEKAWEYYNGSDDVKQDYVKAAQFFSKAAHQGSADGLYNLARMTLEGLGVRQDFKAGIVFLEKAAEMPAFNKKVNIPNLGVKEAQHYLGLLYHEGTYVNINLKLAAYWYEKAVGNGFGSSGNNLGMMYMNGDYVERDLTKAEKLFLFAFSNGDKQVPVNLVYLYSKMTYYEKALKWYDYCENNMLFFTDKDLIDQIRKSINTFKHSPIPKWEKENGLSIDNLSQMERSERYDKSVNNKNSLSSKLMKLEKDLNSNDLSKVANSTNPINIKNLEIYANKGSITAQKILKALESLFNAFNMIMKGSLDEAKILSLFSNAIKLDHSIIFIPSDKKIETTINEIVLKNISNSDKSSELDENARICYTYLNFNNPDLLKEFLSFSIKKYPKSEILFFFMGCILSDLELYEMAISTLNKGLAINPNNDEIIYIKALALIVTYSEDAVSTYKLFLSKAPVDHRKVPECYYALGEYELLPIIKDVESIKKYYQQGITAEKEQLDLYLPYQSSAKRSIETFLNIKNVNQPTITTKLNTYDPARTQLILAHRTGIAQTKQIMSMPSHFHNTQPGLHKSKFKPTDIDKCKQIYLRDIDTTKDYILQGYFVEVVVFDMPKTGGYSAFFLIEDCNKDIQRMAVYNLNMDDNLIIKKYGVGCRIRIYNPYMRQAQDGKPMIRVDDPNTLNVIGYINKPCRMCLKEDCKLICSKCKNAYYCSKDCQQADWSILEHKKICDD